jgi:hypothetical protein
MLMGTSMQSTLVCGKQVSESAVTPFAAMVMATSMEAITSPARREFKSSTKIE